MAAAALTTQEMAVNKELLAVGREQLQKIADAAKGRYVQPAGEGAGLWPVQVTALASFLPDGILTIFLVPRSCWVCTMMPSTADRDVGAVLAVAHDVLEC